MNFEKFFNMNGWTETQGFGGISDVYTITTDSEISDGYTLKTVFNDGGFISENEKYAVSGKISEEDGVFSRTDTIKNTSADTLHIYDYKYRFCVPCGDTEVYTQYNNWQNESDGSWQKLVTSVSAEAEGIRQNENAAPMAAVWNRQTKKGIVFHILPESGWSIKISRKSMHDAGKTIFTVVEIGLNGRGLDLQLKPNGELKLFEVLFYEFEDKDSLDCHKLHKYYNKKYPRRTTPVAYNTWFTFFDNVNIELIKEQIKEAAELGCEYFTLDAGWFGHGAWHRYIGDWEENLNGGYMGRMKEVSDSVYENGMKFGLWLEPERALSSVPIAKEHPEYFFTADGNSCFLDFANPEARKYITDLTLNLIEKYNIAYIKFDFNAGLNFDFSRKAFIDYHRGNIEYVKALKEKHPDIYLENCSSGGYRMNLMQMKYYDSFWFTDNQSMHEGLEIFKNTVLRLPPCVIGKWAAMVSCDGFVPEYGSLDKTIRTLSTDNGTWTAVRSVNPDYATAFLAGGPVGITCDLTRLAPDFKEKLKSFISEYKKDREFWKNASARILINTDKALAMQYESGDKAKIVAYNFSYQPITVTPVLSGREAEITVKAEKCVICDV